MSTGLIALLDDVAALSKMAAASLDDVAAQTVKAGSKAAGIVIDDAAVTPRYVVGLASDRELPIIRKIATGSLRNKLLFLLPGALVLSSVAPWIITPLLMAGGVYLCLEGFHKVAELAGGHGAKSPEERVANAQELEDTRVASAIRTDFILSAEIMAITLAGVSGNSFWTQTAVLGAVGVGMTVLVYGVVGLIVKADDAGVALARTSSQALQWVGRGIVRGMPAFLKMLSFVGMLAMLWVGGGIIVHGLAEFGFAAPEHVVKHAAEAAGAWTPVAVRGALMWFVEATLLGVLGLAIGGAVGQVKH